MKLNLKLRTKLNLILFLLIFLITTLTAGLIYRQMRPQFLEAVEYTLIDMTRFLSAELSQSASNHNGQLETNELEESYQRFIETPFPERNYFDAINNSHIQIYVTDAKGMLLFDSTHKSQIGSDFSNWRDVTLSLRNDYGARASRSDVNNPNTSTHYISAPIKLKNEIIGVISVGKPVESFSGFMTNSKIKITLIFFSSLLLSFFLSSLTSHWLTTPILKLDDYVNGIRNHRPHPFPALPNDEIGYLGENFLHLQNELEGKSYIENYVHNLTHEIKAPLSGIVGAIELLQNPNTSPEDKKNLFNNIRIETSRSLLLVEQLLELASLEVRKHPLKIESFDLVLLVDEVIESLSLQAQPLNIDLIFQQNPNDSVIVKGERLLLWRSIANIIQNAIDFSPLNSTITTSIICNPTSVVVSVLDQGPGIPDFALNKITDRFFSLARPRSGKKSSGLGLSFVIEVIKQHHGELRFRTPPNGGTQVEIELPSEQT